MGALNEGLWEPQMKETSLTTLPSSPGEFAIVNPHLLKTLTEQKLWGPQMKNRILANKGSIQGIEEIPVNPSPKLVRA